MSQQSLVQQFEGLRLDVEPHLSLGGLRVARNVRTADAAARVRPGFTVARRLADGDLWPVALLAAPGGVAAAASETLDAGNRCLAVPLADTAGNGYSVVIG